MVERQDQAPPIPIYMNVGAGTRATGRERVERDAQALGVDVDVRVVEPGELEAALRKAAGPGAPVVGVAGGDGTLRSAAGFLCGRESALAPVPAGTLNRFARRLGLFTLNQALHWMARGASSPVAVGFVDDELFLNTAVFGFYADAVRKRERLRRWIRKWPAAVAGAGAVLLRLPLLDVAVELEGAAGERIRRRTPLLWIGLGDGSFPFVHQAPRRSPARLEVAIVETTTRRGMTALGIRLFARIASGRRPVRVRGIEFFQATQVVLRAAGRVGATLDGEPLRFTAPILVCVQEDALRVIAAPGAVPESVQAEPGLPADDGTEPEGMALPLD